MTILIVLFIFASYFFGIKSIFQDKYIPSIYSRVVWIFLSINNFASVVALKNDLSVLLLAGLGLIGSFFILLLTIKKSKSVFGVTEVVSTMLLLISLAVWMFTKLPLLNLSIGLLAHFIGGIPTIKKVFVDPEDEDFLFWLFFALASILALIKVDKIDLSGYLYPLYIVFFECLITLLCFRRYLKRE